MTRHMKRGRVASGFAFSQMCRCQRSRPKCVWVRARGAPELWVVRVAPGRIMFELDGVPVELAREALLLASANCRSRRDSCSAFRNRRGSVMKAKQRLSDLKVMSGDQVEQGDF